MVAYGDWMPEFQEVWEQLPVGEFTEAEYELAEFFFEEGFMTYHGEAPPADIEFAREQLFEMLGEEWEDYFDWEGWREAMGYE
jgi:hypothetical protein